MDYKYLQLLLSCVSGRDGDHGGGSRLRGSGAQCACLHARWFAGIFRAFCLIVCWDFSIVLFAGLLAGIFLSV